MYKRILWLPEVLDRAGVPYKIVEGFRTRGNPGGSFDPRTVVWHHDASPKGDSPGVVNFLINNFSKGHGAQVWVDREGVWHLIASGRASHAGVVRNAKWANKNSIGIETDHTTGEDWPGAQLVSLRKGTAAILNALRTPATDSLGFHKTICFPPGRKTDPDGLDLRAERKQVLLFQAKLKHPAKAKTPVIGDGYKSSGIRLSSLHPNSTDSISIKNFQRGLKITPTGVYGLATQAKVKEIQRKHGVRQTGIYGALTCTKTQEWQKRAGYKGIYADGFFGPIQIEKFFSEK